MQRRFTMGGMGRHLVGHGMQIGLPRRVDGSVSHLVGNRRRRHHMRGRGVLDDVWSGIKSAGSWVGENIGKIGDVFDKASKVAKVAGYDIPKSDTLEKAKQIHGIVTGSRRRKIRGGMVRRLGAMRGGNVLEDIGKGADWFLDRADKISNIVGKIVAGAKMAGARRKHKKTKGKGRHRKIGRPKKH